MKDCEDFNGSAQKDTIQIIADRESRAFLETTDSNDLKRLAELYVATYVAPTWIKKNTGATGPGGLCTLGGFRCGTKQDLNGFSVGAAECDLKGDLFDRMPTSCHINAALDLTQFNTWCMGKLSSLHLIRQSVACCRDTRLTQYLAIFSQWQRVNTLVAQFQQSWDC